MTNISNDATIATLVTLPSIDVGDPFSFADSLRIIVSFISVSELSNLSQVNQSWHELLSLTNGDSIQGVECYSECVFNHLITLAKPIASSDTKNGSIYEYFHATHLSGINIANKNRFTRNTLPIFGKVSKLLLSYSNREQEKINIENDGKENKEQTEKFKNSNDVESNYCKSKLIKTATESKDDKDNNDEKQEFIITDSNNEEKLNSLSKKNYTQEMLSHVSKFVMLHNVFEALDRELGATNFTNNNYVKENINNENKNKNENRNKNKNINLNPILNQTEKEKQSQSPKAERTKNCNDTKVTKHNNLNSETTITTVSTAKNNNSNNKHVRSDSRSVLNLNGTNERLRRMRVIMWLCESTKEENGVTRTLYRYILGKFRYVSKYYFRHGSFDMNELCLNNFKQGLSQVLHETTVHISPHWIQFFYLNVLCSSNIDASQWCLSLFNENKQLLKDNILASYDLHTRRYFIDIIIISIKILTRKIIDKFEENIERYRQFIDGSKLFNVRELIDPSVMKMIGIMVDLIDECDVHYSQLSQFWSFFVDLTQIARQFWRPLRACGPNNSPNGTMVGVFDQENNIWVIGTLIDAIWDKKTNTKQFQVGMYNI